MSARQPVDQVDELLVGPNVTLPCPLKPGSYDYQLYLFEGMDGMENPQRTLQGKIVVE